MNKLTRLLIPLSTLLIVGCNAPQPQTTIPTTDPTPPSTTTPPQSNSTLPAYFQTGDVTFSTSQEIQILSQKKKDAILAGVNKDADPQSQIKWTDIEPLIHFYNVGQITNSSYKGQDLVLYKQDCDGPCYVAEIDRFAYDKTNQKLTLLAKHSSPADGSFGTGYSSFFADATDKSTELKGVSLPEKIQIPNTDKYLTLEIRDELLNDQLPTFNSTFEDPTYGTVYYNVSQDNLQNTGCFYVKAPDGTASKYKYDPAFFVPGGEGKGFKALTVTWQDGSTPTDIANTYAFNQGGCGFGGNCYTIESVDENTVSLVGKGSNGVNLYESKDPKNNKTIKDLFDLYTSIGSYDDNGNQKPQLSFEDFLKIHPVLFWKDPLNRWSLIINNQVKPAVECGKPVIYLYPQKTTDVNVQVGIEKLTKTIPDYSRTGWTVKAEPNGQLYNYSDGKNYPYLFWEGQSTGTNSADSGFVIERSKLSAFFDDSLAKLGLNKQETSDFKDFWVAKMLDNRQPYFFISFIGTQAFNKVAPLTITPAPDSLLRVFMYYQPLENFINVPKEELRAPIRKGFSVVEWGGTSSVPWKK